MRSNRVVYLPAGSNATIIAHLRRSGIDVNGVDRLLLHLFGYPQHGWIDLKGTYLRRGDFLYRLTHAKAAMVSVTLVPGETLPLFLDRVAKKLHLNRTRLQKAYEIYAPYPDGVLWADTYYVPLGMSEKHLMYTLVRASMARHRRLAKKFFGIYRPKKWFRYVTIASIVQKEAADAREMPRIASVIYNRLRKKMPLQMDGALNYGRFCHVKVTKKRIHDDVTHFNTYRYCGLPPWPVGAISLDALKAAIRPAKTSYLYFVKGPDGRHIFTKRYKAHLRAIRYVKKRNRLKRD